MNADEIAAEIRALEGARDALARDVDAVNLRIRDLQLEAIDLKYGLHVGSIVVRDGKQFFVRGIENVGWTRPWVVGVPMRKDGTWGTAERRLFSDWEVV